MFVYFDRINRIKQIDRINRICRIFFNPNIILSKRATHQILSICLILLILSKIAPHQTLSIQ